MLGLKLSRSHCGLALAITAGASLMASPALVPAVALAQGVAPPAILADAQGYKVQALYIDPMVDPAKDSKEKVRSETQKKVNAAQSEIRGILAGGKSLADSRSRLDYYYTRMMFPKFTQTTDEALKELPKERERLFRDNLEACTDPVIHGYLVRLVLNSMKDIVQDNYHPACRYNAMLTIAGLNNVEAVRVGADKKTPEPLVDALPYLLEQFTKADNNDAIRVAALLGIVRHLEWDNFRGPVGAPTPAIVPAQRDEIVKQLLALALAKDPPAGRDAAGHEWFRRRAIEGLTHVSYNQVDPAVGAALETLVKDDSESLAIRCAAASAMGKVVYRAPAKLDPAPTAKELGYLALVACDKELTRVTGLNKEELDRLQRMGGSGGGGYGGIGGGMSGMSGMDRTESPEPYGGGRGAGGMMRGGPGGRGGSGYPGGSGRSGYPGGSGRGGYPGGSGRSGYPGGSESGSESGYVTAAPADPKQYRFDYVRRRLRSQLYAVEVGLSGPDVNTPPKQVSKPAEGAPAPPEGPPRGVEKLAKGTPDEAAVKEIITLVGKLVDVVESTDNTDMEALEKSLRKEMKPLENKTRKVGATTPADVPADLPGIPGAVPVRPTGAGPARTPPSAGPAARAPGAAATPAASPAAPPAVTPAPVQGRPPSPAAAPAAPVPAAPAPAAPSPVAPTP